MKKFYKFFIVFPIFIFSDYCTSAEIENSTSPNSISTKNSELLENRTVNNKLKNRYRWNDDSFLEKVHLNNYNTAKSEPLTVVTPLVIIGILCLALTAALILKCVAKHDNHNLNPVYLNTPTTSEDFTEHHPSNENLIKEKDKQKKNEISEHQVEIEV